MLKACEPDNAQTSAYAAFAARIAHRGTLLAAGGVRRTGGVGKDREEDIPAAADRGSPGQPVPQHERLQLSAVVDQQTTDRGKLQPKGSMQIHHALLQRR